MLGQSGVGERARDPDDQRFGARLIVGREAAGVRTVEVEHADQSIGRDDRPDEFAAACGIAGDMTATGVYVIDPLALSQPRRGAPHPLFQWDTKARSLSPARPATH